MGSASILTIAVLLISYASVSKRLAGTIVTPAIVFVAAGMILGDAGFDVLDTEASTASLRLLAEATLALVLFSDAASLDTRALRHESSTPIRLLGIGLPLTIVLGSLIAIVLFPDLIPWEAVALAVILAPTDAALGQIVVSDERLPSRLRQGLNVESGLNDGICVPLLFAALAFAALEEAPAFDGAILQDLVTELAIAAGTGALVAAVVALVWRRAQRLETMSAHWAPVVPLAVVIFAYVATHELGGSGFIASFVAGLVFGQMVGPGSEEAIDLTEEVGGVLSATTFFMFAATLVGPAIDRLDVETVAYALLSLTVIRMLPVAIAFIRVGAARQTILFAGWFGPRGLASIVFALTAVEQSGLTGVTRIVDVTTITVLFSVVAHGISAPTLTRLYARSLPDDRAPLDLERVDGPVPTRRRGGVWRHAS